MPITSSTFYIYTITLNLKSKDIKKTLLVIYSKRCDDTNNTRNTLKWTQSFSYQTKQRILIYWRALIFFSDNHLTIREIFAYRF